MNKKIYVLELFTDVDDYKRRGSTPHTDITYSYSENHLYRKVVDIINEDLLDIDCRPKENIKIILDTIKENPDLFIEKKNEYGNEYSLRRNINYKNDDEARKVVELLHENIAKGEYVYYRWTYYIHELENIEEDSEKEFEEDSKKEFEED